MSKNFNASNYDSQGNYVSNRSNKIVIQNPNTQQYKSSDQIDSEFETRVQDKIEQISKTKKFSGKMKDQMEAQQLQELRLSQQEVNNKLRQMEVLEQSRKTRVVEIGLEKLSKMFQVRKKQESQLFLRRLGLSIEYYQLMESCSVDLREVNIKKNFIRYWKEATKKSKLR